MIMMARFWYFYNFYFILLIYFISVKDGHMVDRDKQEFFVYIKNI
jgi:lipid-A-disaccharide synthase-like uncharacterized protein